MKYTQRLIPSCFGFAVSPCWLISSPSWTGLGDPSSLVYLSLSHLLPPSLSCVFSGFLFVWQWRESDISSHLSYPAQPSFPPHSFHTLEQIKALPHYPHPHLTGLEVEKKTQFFSLSRFQTITFFKKALRCGLSAFSPPTPRPIPHPEPLSSPPPN